MERVFEEYEHSVEVCFFFKCETTWQTLTHELQFTIGGKEQGK
jgi:hypothetical protein